MKEFPRIEGCDIALDTETSGLRWFKESVIGVTVATADTEWYFDTRLQPGALPWLTDTLRGVKRVVLHNAKFDAHFLANEGIHLPWDRVDDTMVLAGLCNEHEPSYSLDNLGKKYIGQEKVDIVPKLAEIFGGPKTANVQMPNLCKAPPELVGPYAMRDSRNTFDLARHYYAEIERQGIHDIVAFERKVTPVLFRCERRGVRGDIEKAEERAALLVASIAERQAALNTLAGFECNVASSDQMVRLFNPQRCAGVADDEQGFTWRVGDVMIPSTEGGQPSITAAALRTINHPAAPLVLALRQERKTLESFIRGYVLDRHHMGRIYPNINQTKAARGYGESRDEGTTTGRLSMTDPNLQAVSKRNPKAARVIRELFLPDEGQQWVSGDLGQSDARWFAHYVGDPSILARYAANPKTDFYQVLSDMTSIPRNPREDGGPNTKQITLSLIFGAGKGKIADEMGMPTEIVKFRGMDVRVPGPEAKAMFAQFFQSVPGIESHLKTAEAVAKQRGYVRSIAGRRLRFPGGKSSHKAGGNLLQAATADSIKAIMVALDAEMPQYGANLLFSVHDEADLTAPNDPAIVAKVEEVMRSLGGIKADVPFIADVTHGANWADASL